MRVFFSDHSSTFSVPAPNTSGYIIGQRPRSFVSQPSHNVSDMKHNHISNMTHGKLNRQC